MKNDAWYAQTGIDTDVVLSVRVRLARNLANFTFPSVLKQDEAQRIQTLVFDSFAQCSTPDLFQALPASCLDDVGAKILAERGVIDYSILKNQSTGVVMRTDGTISCTVNDQDHVRISSFASGLDFEKVWGNCKKIDEELQNTIQFAASYEFGYLTSHVKDAGSGMKITARLHLPSMSCLGLIRKAVDDCGKQNLDVLICYGAGNYDSSSLGSFYQIATRSAGSGSEAEQIANLSAMVKYLIEKERNSYDECKKKHGTEIKDRVLKAYAFIKFSTLADIRPSIEAISDIKWGKNLGMIEGIDDSEISALLYRIQEGHLEYVIKDETVKFPDDIKDNKKLKQDYIRALILRETFENLKIL